MIFAVRTTIGREKPVMSMLKDEAKLKGFDIKAILHPENLKGYIFVEGKEGDIRESLHGMRHVKGVIPKEVKLEEIKHFLETKKIEIKRGDKIEIISGPLKGEKGKINRVDESKDEAIIELLEAAVPITVTLSTDSMRVIEKKGEE